MDLNFVLFISTQPFYHSQWWCMLVHFHMKQFEMILHYILSLALCLYFFFPVLQKIKLGRVLLCILGCTGAHYIVQAGLKLIDIRGLRHHPGLVLLGRKHIFWHYLCNKGSSKAKYMLYKLGKGISNLQFIWHFLALLWSKLYEGKTCFWHKKKHGRRFVSIIEIMFSKYFQFARQLSCLSGSLSSF